MSLKDATDVFCVLVFKYSHALSLDCTLTNPGDSGDTTVCTVPLLFHRVKGTLVAIVQYRLVGADERVAYVLFQRPFGGCFKVFPLLWMAVCPRFFIRFSILAPVVFTMGTKS